MPERLRTLRHCIFTGGVATENCICSAAFCESAARRGIKLPQSPTATAPSEMGPLAKPETFPPCQRLPPRGSWQNRQVLTEGVQPSPWGRWLDAKRQDGRGSLCGGHSKSSHTSKGRCTVRCSGLCFPHFYFAVLIKLRLSHRYLMPEMAVTAATTQHSTEAMSAHCWPSTLPVRETVK